MAKKKPKKVSQYSKLIGMEMRTEVKKLKKHTVTKEVYDKKELQAAFKRASAKAFGIIHSKKVKK